MRTMKQSRLARRSILVFFAASLGMAILLSAGFAVFYWTCLPHIRFVEDDPATVHQVKCPGPVLSVLFRDKQVLIAAEGELLVLDIDKKEVVHSIHAPSYIMVMALSPDHSQLLVSTYHDGLVLYSVEDWSCKRSYWLPGAGAPQAVRWAADSRA